MQLEEVAYYTDNAVTKQTTSLIDYLKRKSIITTVDEEAGIYKIDVEKLTGSKQLTGNGTASGTDTTAYKDVYVLEKQETEGASIINKKLATTRSIKLAATSTSSLVTYDVRYYGNKASENYTPGTIVDANGTTVANVTNKSENLKMYFNLKSNGEDTTSTGIIESELDELYQDFESTPSLDWYLYQDSVYKKWWSNDANEYEVELVNKIDTSNFAELTVFTYIDNSEEIEYKVLVTRDKVVHGRYWRVDDFSEFEYDWLTGSGFYCLDNPLPTFYDLNGNFLGYGEPTL